MVEVACESPIVKPTVWKRKCGCVREGETVLATGNYGKPLFPIPRTVPSSVDSHTRAHFAGAQRRYLHLRGSYPTTPNVDKSAWCAFCASFGATTALIRISLVFTICTLMTAFASARNIFSPTPV